MSDRPTAEYAAAMGFLYGRINYEQAAKVPYHPRDMNLGKMCQLLDRLGNPHQHLPIVHVAGTKGKGSTAAMIGSVLVTAGFQVGLYTSPHLAALEERLAVNGEPCTRDEMVALVETLQGVVHQMDEAAEGIVDRPTFFEITTAMGLLHFARRKVDVGVLEVGLGGRLDATNVCDPLVSVITSISFDHTQQLGNTLSAIAGEKAGIIKPRVPVVSGVVAPEPAAVIAEVARRHDSPLVRRDREFFVQDHPSRSGGPGKIDFEIRIPDSNWKLSGVPLGMLGRHQADNAGVALAALDRLKVLGWAISDEDCRRGLAIARCPARIEVLSRQPTVVLDTAHNLASVEALVTTLDESFSPGQRVLIFGAARDKDVAGMLRQLLPRFEHVILTQFTSNPRGFPVGQLMELAQQVAEELTSPVASLQAEPTPEQAWRSWLRHATPQSLVCITGSFFLAAEFQHGLSVWGHTLD